MIYRVLKGWKYRLERDYSVRLNFFPRDDIRTEFIQFTATGVLTVKKGYAWDGCSGPTIDDKTNMRGGLIHDVLYQLLRLGLLHPVFRELADKEFHRICLEDGMNKFRAWYYYIAVRIFAGKCAKAGTEKPPIIKEAPCGVK